MTTLCIVLQCFVICFFATCAVILYKVYKQQAAMLERLEENELLSHFEGLSDEAIEDIIKNALPETKDEES